VSAVRKSSAQPKLVKMLREPGGMRVREALARAQAALEELHEACLESIDAALDGMESELPRWPGSAEEIYDQSTRVIDACNQPQERALAAAARSLCDIVDQLDVRDPRTLEAVKVHVKAFRVLHRSAAPDEARGLILNGLEAVCAKLRVEPSAAPEEPEDEAVEVDDEALPNEA
jgi:hypothetical protein